MKDVESFGGTAKVLSRNPLGIIALFIVLVYALAALVLGLSLGKLTPEERAPLIYFLIIFPFVVLLAFYLLVAKHYQKLYGPSEFRDERNFLQPLSQETQKQRIIQEVTAPPSPHSESDVAKGRQKREQLKLSASDYLLAETMALRDMARNLNVPIHPQVKLTSGEEEVQLDAVSFSGKKLTAIEVKLLQDSLAPGKSVESIIEKTSSIAESLIKSGKVDDFSLYLCFISDDDNKLDTELEGRLKDFANKHRINLNLKYYDLQSLKNQFGLVENLPLTDSSALKPK